jgi:hypothetical protein
MTMDAHLEDGETSSELNTCITMKIPYIIHRVFYLKHKVPHTGYCLRVQVYLVSWAQSTELLEDGDVPVSYIKDWTLDNVQNFNSCIDIPLSQTYKSYPETCYNSLR